jgi:hypothetical protein
MYKLNKESKTLEEIHESTFENLDLKERKDIQEWICKEPRILGEELLIIAKEFDGFEGTKERLDLLALDKEGNLVVIENKRDDSGKEVNWQSIKYASYCSTLKKEDVISIYKKYIQKNKLDIDAEQSISMFFDDESIPYPTDVQRIILVAHTFRKEVLSAAQWLFDKNIDIKCVSIIPYINGDEVLLDSNILLPQEENKDYLLKIAEQKAEYNKQKKEVIKAETEYSAFWENFGEKFSNKEKSRFKGRAFVGNLDAYISGCAGIKLGPRFGFQFYTNKSGSRIQLVIDSAKGSILNAKMYEYLFSKKDEIESKITGFKVEWVNNQGQSSKRVLISDVSLVFGEDNYDKICDFFDKNILMFENAFAPYFDHLRKLYNDFDKNK